MSKTTTNKDRLRMRWIEQHQAKVEYRPIMPDGKITDRPWWICSGNGNPWRGVTLRQAIDRAIKAQRTTDCVRLNLAAIDNVDLRSIIEALRPAAEPFWWRSYLEYLAKSKRYREMARECTDPESRDQAIHMNEAAEQYAEVARNHSKAFWAAWFRLADVGYREAKELQPMSAADTKQTDPTEAARAVYGAMVLLRGW
jgi:hypothetical protein